MVGELLYCIQIPFIKRHTQKDKDTLKNAKTYDQNCDGSIAVLGKIEHILDNKTLFTLTFLPLTDILLISRQIMLQGKDVVHLQFYQRKKQNKKQKKTLECNNTSKALVF